MLRSYAEVLMIESDKLVLVQACVVFVGCNRVLSLLLEYSYGGYGRIFLV